MTTNESPTPHNASDEEQTATRQIQFAEDVKTFNFLYQCKDCIHYDAAQTACSMNFPLPATLIAKQGATLWDKFCKYFEIL